MRVDCCQDSFRLPSWARLVCPRLPANHSNQTFTRFLASMKTSPPRLAISNSTKGPLLAPGLPSQRRDHLVQANVGGWRQDPGGQWMGNGGFQNRWPFKFIFFLEVGKSRETDGNSTFPYVSLLFHYCFVHAYQQIPAATPCLKECASFRAKSSDWSRALRDGSRCFQSFFQTSFGKKNKLRRVGNGWKLKLGCGNWILKKWWFMNAYSFAGKKT